MSGTKGHSGGHNAKTNRERQMLGVKPDRINDNSPAIIQNNLPAETTWITKHLNEVGLQVFSHLWPMIWNNGTLSETDAIALQALCVCYQEWDSACQELKDNSSTINTYDNEGNLKNILISPWAKRYQMLTDQLIKLCREFGLTPLSRGSIDAIKRGVDDDPFKDDE